MTEGLKIAPGILAKQWRKQTLDVTSPESADWAKAVEIFDARIRGRFFAPVDALIDSEQDQRNKTFGFTILATDCLVMETLQGFREGEVNHNGISGRLFRSFLTGWEVFRSCLPQNGNAERLADRVYIDCRCALLHSGATDGELRVGVSGPAFKFAGNHVERINRTSLHNGLKREFDGYLARLRQADQDVLRRNFKTKMDAIAGA
jgi:hypothetical protein